jgi:hypothetical protein
MIGNLSITHQVHIIPVQMNLQNDLCKNLLKRCCGSRVKIIKKILGLQVSITVRYYRKVILKYIHTSKIHNNQRIDKLVLFVAENVIFSEKKVRQSAVHRLY